MGGLKSLGKALMSPAKGLMGLVRGGKNPADASRQYLEPIPGYGREAYDPYVQQGKEAWGKLFPQYEKLVNDPRGLYNEDAASYVPSEFYQSQVPYLNQAMENTAGAGGYGGTQNDQLQRADMIKQLMGVDFGNYMEGVNRNRMSGIQGFETATGRGSQAAGSLADYLGNAATGRADLEYSGKAQQSNNKMKFMSALMQAVATGFGGGMKPPGETPGTQQGQQMGQQGLRNIQTRTQGMSPGTNASRPYNNWGGRQ